MPSFSLGGTGQSTVLGGASSSTAPQTAASSLGSSLTAPSTTSNVNPTPVLGSSQQTTNANASITYKVLEDYINKWMGDLDEQEKDFLNQATQLNALDKLMMDNGEKVFYKLIQSFYVKKAIGTFNLSK